MLTKEEFAKNEEKIVAMHGKHSGKRGFILGCGPSLNKMDLSKLKDEIVIILNRGYLLMPRLGKIAEYWVGVNPNVLHQWRDEIAHDLVVHPCERFVPMWSEDMFRASTQTPPWPRFTFLDTTGSKGFAPDLRPMHWPLREGYTVTYVALQIAYHLGFSDVHLIGVDHHYPLSDPDHPNEIGRFVADDINHFDLSYFRGMMWHQPDLKNSEVSYELAKEAFEKAGRHVWNSGVDSLLDIFPRKPYEELF